MTNKSMASNASKTLRNKRASKITKSYAGSVLAKSKYKQPQKKQANKKKTSKKKNGRSNK